MSATIPRTSTVTCGSPTVSTSRRATSCSSTEATSSTGTGTSNGAPTGALGPFEGLPDRIVQTQLTYTGERTGRVRTKVDVSAKLETVDGTPLEGITITFSRAGKTASAVTGPDGVAATKLQVANPDGRSRSIAVRFAGADPYTAVQIVVPFRARPR